MIKENGLELNTFGKNPAAQTLVRILQNYNKMASKRVSAIFHRYTTGLAHIEDEITSSHIRSSLSYLWLQKSICEAETSTGVPDECRSFLCNIIKASNRKYKRREQIRAKYSRN